MENTFHRSELPSETFAMPVPAPLDLSIILVNWNTRDMLRECLESIIAEHDDLQIEIFVIDNDSKDGSPQMVSREFKQVELIENSRNVGFACANNQGFARSRGKYVLLLNPDTIILPGALSQMVNFLKVTPEAGAIAAKLLNTDGSLQYSLRQFPTLLTPFTENPRFHEVPIVKKYARISRLEDWDHSHLKEVDQPAGAAFMIKRSVIETLGALNGDYHMFFEDVDICYRIKQNGWKIFYLPSAVIIHHGGQSVKKRENIGDEFYRSLIRFFSLHNGRSGANMVLLCMTLGSLLILAYSLVSAIVHPIQSLNFAKNALRVFRCAVRFRHVPSSA